MSTLKLTDKFGLVIDTVPSIGSLFSKYLKGPDAIIGALRNATPIKDLQIGDDPLQSQSLGISFDQPVKFGSTGVELTITPQLVATISINKGKSLFDAETDPFREIIPIPEKYAFLAAALKATLDTAGSDEIGDLQFGFNTGNDIVITNYVLFSVSDRIVPAVQSLLQQFVVPGDLEDIDQLAEHDTVTVEGTGSLKFAAKANLLSTINPLATVNTGMLPIKIADAASLTVSAAYTLTGEYQVRIERLTGRKFRLGYQKKHSAEFDVSVAAQVGVSASAGGFELIQSVLQMVSADAVPSKDEFHQTGLSDEQIATISAAIKAGIERSLKLSLAGELDALDSASSAFSYEIDPDTLEAGGRQAVHDALRGDLTGLELLGVAGITRVKSIFTMLQQRKNILKVNLLGIFNYGSVSTLFQKGTIIVDPEVGDITITDEAGAERIQFTTDNFAQDAAKLRRVLAESLLITAAYRCSGTIDTGPQLSNHYWFFEQHQKTNLQQMTDYLNIAQALQLLRPVDVNNKLKSIVGIAELGRSTFYIDASYTDVLCKRMFLDANAQPRAEDEYETIGRKALLLLLPPGDPLNNARRLPLLDDATWKAMGIAGQPSFPVLFQTRGFNANQLADITSDYTLIKWWATSMHRMGEALAQILAFVVNNPAFDRENTTFKRLRSNLDSAMVSVVSNTKAQFAEPWGISALDLASDQQGDITLRLVSPRLSLAATQRIGPFAKGEAN